ncbi:hypothetical protein BMS3Bbin04_01942 [bacterium BMS3Bbin04]|nr:hypothetical protein BMS3Bbin04_01942 [bacterium BMS3Bbin04]
MSDGDFRQGEVFVEYKNTKWFAMFIDTDFYVDRVETTFSSILLNPTYQHFLQGYPTHQPILTMSVILFEGVVLFFLSFGEYNMN